jgi:hypothetical protein
MNRLEAIVFGLRFTSHTMADVADILNRMFYADPPFTRDEVRVIAYRADEIAGVNPDTFPFRHVADNDDDAWQELRYRLIAEFR